MIFITWQFLMRAKSVRRKACTNRIYRLYVPTVERIEIKVLCKLCLRLLKS
jgi:hypothetical protein